MKPNHGHRQKSLTLPAVGRQLALYASYEPSPLPPLTVCSETEKSFVRRLKPSTTIFSISCAALRRLTPFFGLGLTGMAKIALPRIGGLICLVESSPVSKDVFHHHGNGPASSQQLEAVSLAECRVLTAALINRGKIRFQWWQMTIQSWQIKFQPWQMTIQPGQMTLQWWQKAPNPNVFNECVENSLKKYFDLRIVK